MYELKHVGRRERKMSEFTDIVVILDDARVSECSDLDLFRSNDAFFEWIFDCCIPWIVGASVESVLALLME